MGEGKGFVVVANRWGNLRFAVGVEGHRPQAKDVLFAL